MELLPKNSFLAQADQMKPTTLFWRILKIHKTAQKYKTIVSPSYYLWKVLFSFLTWIKTFLPLNVGGKNNDVIMVGWRGTRELRF